jgi:hypothetical protein
MKQWFRVFLMSTLVVLLTACGGGSTGSGGNNNGSTGTTVDTTAPVITLNGEANTTLNVGVTYTEAGATATDNVDGTVTVVTTGTVDTTAAGTYTITYTATDAAGNVGTNTRMVTVAPALKLKKTGQTVSYYPKDDGDYQKGITPNYTRDDSKEVVMDNVTGLMWQDDSDAATVKKPWVTQANYHDGNYSNTSGDTPTTYCAELTLGDYSDWRLPSVEELESIVDFGRVSPSINPAFIHIVSHYYWSSTAYAGGAYGVWFVY